MKTKFDTYEQAKEYFSALKTSSIRTVEDLALAFSFCLDRLNSKIPDEDYDFWMECTDKLNHKISRMRCLDGLRTDQDIITQLKERFSIQDVAFILSFSMDWENASDEELKYISNFHKTLPEGDGEKTLFKELCRERCRRSPELLS